MGDNQVKKGGGVKDHGKGRKRMKDTIEREKKKIKNRGREAREKCKERRKGLKKQGGRLPMS